MFSTVTSNYKKMLLVSNTFLVDAFNITLDSYEYFFFFPKNVSFLMERQTEGKGKYK